MSQQHGPSPAPARLRHSGLSAIALGTSAIGSTALGQPIRFGDPIVYGDVGSAGQMITVDLDRDGDIDVVTAGETMSIVLLHNDGAGGLVQVASLPISNSYLLSLDAADMDGDLDVDVVWFDRLPDRTYVLSIWYNSGDGLTGEIVQTPIPTSAGDTSLIADIDGDGLEDALYRTNSRTISALLNNGDRTFRQSDLYTYYSSQYDLQAMVRGDFDGDGDLDLAATFQYAYSGHYYSVKGTQVALLINDGSGAIHLESETELPWQSLDISAFDMTTGDLDGDGDLDVIVAGGTWNRDFSNEFIMLRNDEGHSLEIAATVRASSGSFCSVGAGDINTDGRLDLLFAVSDVAGVYVVQNMGDFTFAGQSPLLTTVAGYGLGIADLTGDGQLDLIQAGSRRFATIANITALRTPTYDHSTLQRGQEAVFVVTGAQPGEDVWFVYSREGAGNSLGYRVIGGLTLDVLEHFEVFGVATVGPNGRAVLRRSIPLNTPLGPVTTQAVIRRGPDGVDSVKTPFHTSVISD